MLVSVAGTIGLLALFLLQPQYSEWRWTVFFPAAALGVNFQQWYYGFCIRLGFAGLFNFGEIGKTTAVASSAHVKKDRSKAMQIVLVSMVFGFLVTAALYVLA